MSNELDLLKKTTLGHVIQSSDHVSEIADLYIAVKADLPLLDSAPIGSTAYIALPIFLGVGRYIKSIVGWEKFLTGNSESSILISNNPFNIEISYNLISKTIHYLLPSNNPLQIEYINNTINAPTLILYPNIAIVELNLYFFPINSVMYKDSKETILKGFDIVCSDIHSITDVDYIAPKYVVPSKNDLSLYVEPYFIQHLFLATLDRYQYLDFYLDNDPVLLNVEYAIKFTNYPDVLDFEEDDYFYFVPIAEDNKANNVITYEILEKPVFLTWNGTALSGNVKKDLNSDISIKAFTEFGNTVLTFYINITKPYIISNTSSTISTYYENSNDTYSLASSGLDNFFTVLEFDAYNKNTKHLMRFILGTSSWITKELDNPPNWDVIPLLKDIPMFSKGFNADLSGSEATWGEIKLLNPGQLDALTTDYVTRSQQFKLKYGKKSWNYKDFINLYSGRINNEGIKQINQIEATINIRSEMILFDTNLSTAKYSKNDELNPDKAIPLCFGGTDDHPIFNITPINVGEILDYNKLVYDFGSIGDQLRKVMKKDVYGNYVDVPYILNQDIPKTFKLINAISDEIYCHVYNETDKILHTYEIPKIYREKNLVYQYHNGPAGGVVTVRDGGGAVDFIDIPEKGCFRLLAPPVREITCDVKGGLNKDGTRSYNAAELILNIVKDYTKLDPSLIDMQSFNDIIYKWRDTVVGVYLPEFKNVKELINEIASSVLCIVDFTKNGKLRIQSYFTRTLKFTTQNSYLDCPPFYEIDDNDLGASLELSEFRPAEKEIGISYKKNWTVLSNIEPEVNDNNPELKILLKEESSKLYKSTNLEGVFTDYLSTLPPEPHTTLIIDRNSATRVLDLIGYYRFVDRKIYSLKIHNIGNLLDLGDLIRVKIDRYGISNKTACIIKIESGITSTSNISFII